MRKTDLAISFLISSYYKLDEIDFKKEFKKFTNDYYLEAIENIDNSNDKEEIIKYTKIIQTYNIFNTLLSFEDDYDTIIKCINKEPKLFEIVLNLSESYHSHSGLARALKISEKKLAALILTIPHFGLFTKVANNSSFDKEPFYYITPKGKLFVEKMKELCLINKKDKTEV